MAQMFINAAETGAFFSAAGGWMAAWATSCILDHAS
jgi:hypothetical protein